jgi:anti-sigma factor RsiW
MTCRELADFLADYLSDELTADVRERFERHLALCPNCRAYLATYRATMALSATAYATPGEPAAAPEDLVAAIVASLGD